MVNATPWPLYHRETDPVPIVQAAWWAPGSVCRGAKIPPQPGFYPRIVLPVASRYTDWAIPAPHGPVHSLQYIQHFTNTWIWRTWRVPSIPRREGAICYRYRPVLMAVLEPTSWHAVWTAAIVLSFVLSKRVQVCFTSASRSCSSPEAFLQITSKTHYFVNPRLRELI